MGQDGFIDIWIKRTGRSDFLCNIWRQDIIESINNFYRVDLVPLNKVWPDIPKKE